MMASPMTARERSQDTNVGLATGGTGLSLNVDVKHFLGSNPSNAVETRTIDIDTSSPPDRVVVRSFVVASNVRTLNSPKYLAAIRRRRSQNVASLIERLGDHEDDPNFAVWTQEPLSKLKTLINALSVAEQEQEIQVEGNSCEVLRQIRDTLLGDGWRRYSNGEVREAVLRILSSLSSKDDVTASDVDEFAEQLMDAELDPYLGTDVLTGLADVEEKIPG
jgi:hypothetical protein